MARVIKRMIPLFLLCLFLLFVHSDISLAEIPAKDLEQRNIDSPFGKTREGASYTTNLVYVILVLILIIGMILILVKFLAKKNKSWMANRAVRLLGGVNLGQNKAVQIIETGHSIYLVGVGENVQLIDKIDDPEEVAFILNTINTNDQSFKFTETLQSLQMPKWVKRVIRSDKREEEETDANLSFQDIFQSKIKQLTNRKKRVEEIIADETKEERSNDT
ncbi:MAG TPA: flagellar biosynthetic protein FliO [Bacilli bacterium]